LLPEALGQTRARVVVVVGAASFLVMTAFQVALL
jgi:hypothetical protein